MDTYTRDADSSLAWPGSCHCRCHRRDHNPSTHHLQAVTFLSICKKSGVATEYMDDYGASAGACSHTRRLWRRIHNAICAIRQDMSWAMSETTASRSMSHILLVLFQMTGLYTESTQSPYTIICSHNTGQKYDEGIFRT
jgi:hypothetical protein